MRNLKVLIDKIKNRASVNDLYNTVEQMFLNDCEFDKALINFVRTSTRNFILKH